MPAIFYLKCNADGCTSAWSVPLGSSEGFDVPTIYAEVGQHLAVNQGHRLGVEVGWMEPPPTPPEG